MKHQLLWGTAVWAIIAAAAPAAEPKLTPEAQAFFESRIRPLLIEQCYKCHSQGSEKVRGGLLLDSRDGLLKGGSSGPAIVPGDPDASLLIQAVRYQDKDLQMPPNDRKLSAGQIADLEAWVKMGAPDPRVGGPDAVNAYAVELEQAKKHWAFRPVARPAVPALNDPWIRTPIDSFILAGLRSKELAPARPADKVTLLRRASFDLTGLPPTMKEVEAFLADDASDAFARVVDRLLASPRYGERWGRYWLDLAKYADTKGRVRDNEDPRYASAYTYRDYVIRAFSDDLPYDRFVMQQIAADLLPTAGDKRTLAALGFLTLGNRFGGQKHDVIDDRIDTVAKSTMALTVACARCHDHKFDPIPTRDYYSLHGVFNSTVEPVEGPLLDDPRNTPGYQKYAGELAAAQAAVDKFEADVARGLRYELRQRIGEYWLALHDYQQSPPPNTSRNRFLQQRKLTPQIASAWERILESRARKHDPIFAPWFAFSRLPEKEFAAQARSLSAQFAANADQKKPLNPLVARMFVTAPASLGQVAARYSALFVDVDKRWQTLLLTAQAGAKGENANAAAVTKFPDPDLEAIRRVLYSPNSPAHVDEQRVRQHIDRNEQVRNRYNALVRAVNNLKANHPGAPPRLHVLAEAERPRDSAVFIKGNPGNRGQTVPRQFLEFIAGGQRRPFQQGSGRLELAQAIVSPDNPLTARVIVNRVWLHHFGQGLVRTPDDFGLRSEAPSHPELLDFLAAWLVENGWSLKKLHRLIMLSSVYQQSSDENPRYAQIDPENRFLWQMNRRRLDFESLRDTILHLGGKLDLTMGGPGVRLDAEPYPVRRSVYGYVDRNNLPNMFLAFDFANPDLTTGKRDETIVPQQALFLMNSPLVVEQARNLARRPDFKLLAKPEDKVQLLYQLIFQRAPTDVERKLALAYVAAESGGGVNPARAVWEYGYGEYDAVARRVRNFAQLPVFNGNAWTVDNRTARGRSGRVILHADGGTPGASAQAAAIRRWVAPRDGFIAIDGTLAAGKSGEGLSAWIVSSTLGELGRFAVPKAAMPAKVPRVLVKQGDTIDFVVIGRGGFNWAPAIRYVDVPATATQWAWDARKDFSGTLAARQMDPWEKLVQVLLETNEMSFVN